ncbi:MAG: PEP/pyruvate-binding domain-containing protein [Cyclobacteriaceae bacterium]
MKITYLKSSFLNLSVSVATCLLISLQLCLWAGFTANGQPKLTSEAIQQLVERLKADQRGPYKDIRWFCTDGSFRAPQERCPEPSPQRARYKDEVVTLAASNGIYLGQILSTTPISDFWDHDNAHSRLKQYQLEKYLRAVDNGWVLRKGQYYRGALQAEDEENWGNLFFSKMLEDKLLIERNYFLLRESARDIPHQGDDNNAQRIRSLSMVISDQYPEFMNIRIKIHGQPDITDIELTQNFSSKNAAKLNDELKKSFDELISELETYYEPVQRSSYARYTKRLPKSVESIQFVSKFLNDYYSMPSGLERIDLSAKALYEMRLALASPLSGSARLAMMDISLLAEKTLLQDLGEWQPSTVKELMNVTYSLGWALAGTGYIELWEWESLSPQLLPPTGNSVNLATLRTYFEKSRSLVEWGTGMVRAVYQPTITLFSGFEPLSSGFIDDRVRSSLLLPLGRFVAAHGDNFASQAGLTNKVMNIPEQGRIRGLNPGYAMGELVVIEELGEADVDASKIYVFEQPPADLKPVAGIATVSEGNAVSHVQLLARNLGIPNMILAKDNLMALKAYEGQKVFYAVSNSGTAIMKLASEMSDAERQLFSKKIRSEDMITVPVDRIQLTGSGVVNLRDIRADDSGKLCGPKAANLGQLKALFPDEVVEGMALPFSIFLTHMKQPIPGKGMSYWEYLNKIFSDSKAMIKAGKSLGEIETYTLAELAKLRDDIKSMKLIPSFETELEKAFQTILGSPMGKVPVFLRSDTNMEDLKDFTGAGLNLTVFNVVSKEKIWQGIKDVWASPYTERSYKWRQKYLLNPENVYPSILIIPSVDVDYSGVLITKGVSSNNPQDLTVAFSRGAGGAVDGQSAESYLLTYEGPSELLSPAREPFFNRLPAAGGMEKNSATYEKRVLKPVNLNRIRKLSAEARRILPNTPGVESQGPFDIELGFKDDKLWLFQIRPFVENKKAVSSEYLQSISPKIDLKKTVDLSQNIAQ